MAAQYETLVVPGFHGSGAAHWQTWLEQQLPCARRVSGIDWEQPVLSEWVEALHAELDRAEYPVWIVAHSFGSLASVAAVASRGEGVAGLICVAPADPERFSPLGVRRGEHASQLQSVASLLPQSPLSVPSLVVASTDDPWVKLSVATSWARRWGSRLVNIGAAGHINADSGFGPWPQGLQLLREMQAAHGAAKLIKLAV